MLQKISGDTNSINWFEIPALDLERARKFYETVLDIRMESQTMPTGEVMVFFPRRPDTIMALSGIVSGALIKNDHTKPSAEGTLVYLNASPLLSVAVDKVAAAGGKVIQAPNKIPAGNIAIILDTEGNRVGLHAEN